LGLLGKGEAGREFFANERQSTTTERRKRKFRPKKDLGDDFREKKRKKGSRVCRRSAQPKHKISMSARGIRDARQLPGGKGGSQDF